MMKRKTISLLSLLAVVVGLSAMYVGCTDKSTQSEDLAGNGVVLRTTVSMPALLGQVDFVRLSVTGRDMSPILLDSRGDTTSLKFDGAVIQAALDIPYGTDRVFVLEAVRTVVGNINGEIVIYRGEQTISVLPGRLTTVDLVLEPAIPLVRFLPRRVEAEAGKVFAVDVLVANVDSLTSIQLQLDFNQDRLQIVKTEPSEELVAAVGEGLVFTARWQLDATVYRITVARAETYDPIVDAAGNRRLCTVYFNSAIDTARTDADSVESVLTTSVINALKPGAAAPVVITDELYTDDATVHLGLQQNRVVTFVDPDVTAAVRNKIEKPTGDIMLFDVLWLHDLSLQELNVEDLGGLENLVSLDTLWLDYCNILDLTPISELVRLTELTAEGNGLSDLTALSGLVGLETLDLADNSISDLDPLANLTRLTWLNLGGNQIADISVLQDKTWLKTVVLTNNEITDIHPLVANSGMGVYDTLYLGGNAGITGSDIQMGYVDSLRNRGVTVYTGLVR